MRISEIARVCHEVNRAYCAALGDFSHEPWETAPEWQLNSAIQGVCFHLNNLDASVGASHENWLAQKRSDGWEYGEAKDEIAKEHPCMVPFDDLPIEQKAKDFIFRAVVHALS